MMDFICRLSHSKQGHEIIWIVVDRFTKAAYFLPMNMTNPIDKHSPLYIKEVIRLHGAPLSIV